MIDKESAQWKELPWWFRANMFGVYTRRHVLMVEFFLLALGFVFLFFNEDKFGCATFFLGAYITGWIVRYGDRKEVW